MAGDKSQNKEGFIIEIRQVGDYLKATAIDTITGIEASVIASPKISKKQVSDLAARKLRYVLAKRFSSESVDDEGEFRDEGDDTII